MIHTAEPFNALTSAFHDHTGRFASLSLDKVERLARFNLESTHVVLQQWAYTGQAIASMRDEAENSSLRAKLAGAAAQNVRAYSLGVLEIAADAQAGFSKVADEACAAWREGVAAWTESIAKNPPSGSNVAVDAFRSNAAAASAAFDQFTRVNQRVAGLVERAMRATTVSAPTGPSPTTNGPRVG